MIKNIFLSVLYYLDVGALSKAQVIELFENSDNIEHVTPDYLMEFTHRVVYKGYMTDTTYCRLRKAVKDACFLAYSNQHSAKIIAKKTKNMIRGYRISEAHRLAKLQKALDEIDI